MTDQIIIKQGEYDDEGNLVSVRLTGDTFTALMSEYGAALSKVEDLQHKVGDLRMNLNDERNLRNGILLIVVFVLFFVNPILTAFLGTPVAVYALWKLFSGREREG